MEAIAALGLACNVIQLVECGLTLAQKGKQLYESGSTKEHANLESNLIEISKFTSAVEDSLKTSKTIGKLSREEKELQECAVQCSTTAFKLKNILEDYKVKTGRKRDIVKNLVKSTAKKHEIDELKSRLESQRAILDSRILENLRSELKRVRADQQDGFDRLDDQVKMVGRALMEQTTATSTSLVEVIRGELKTINSTTIEQGVETRAFIHQEIVGLQTKLSQSDLSEGAVDRFIRSLDFPEMHSRHEDVSDAYTKTCRWIFGAEGDKKLPFSDFTKWLREGRGYYWIGGKAGSGKSTLMNFIFNAQETKDGLDAWGEDVVKLSFFFWKPGTELQKTLKGFYRALLYQLVINDRELAVLAFDALYEVQRSGFHSVGSQVIWPEKRLRAILRYIFKSTVSRRKKYFLFVDALDECESDQTELLADLDIILVGSHIKACISSRPLPIFTKHFDSMPKLKLEDLNRNDLSNYVKQRLEQDLLKLNPCSSTDQIKRFLSDLVVGASGIFLWIKLVTQDMFKAISNGDDLDDLRKRLEIIPSELEDLFQHMLDQLDRVYYNTALMYFDLMMSTEETKFLIVFALASWEPLRSIKASSMSSLSKENGLDHIDFVKRTLPARTAGLLELAKSKKSRSRRYRRRRTVEKEPLLSTTSRVNFLHRSVNDWLSSGTGLPQLLNRNPQSALGALLKATILACKWSNIAPHTNCDFFWHEMNLHFIFSEKIDFRVFCDMAFTFAFQIEERFKLTSEDVLDEFGKILLGKSHTSPWTICSPRMQGMIIAHDWAGLAVSRGLWLYGNAKAQQQKSTDIANYAAYLLSCTVTGISPDDDDENIFERLSTFIDQRLENGADPNARIQVQHHYGPYSSGSYVTPWQTLFRHTNSSERYFKVNNSDGFAHFARKYIDIGTRPVDMVSVPYTLSLPKFSTQFSLVFVIKSPVCHLINSSTMATIEGLKPLTDCHIEKDIHQRPSIDRLGITHYKYVDSWRCVDLTYDEQITLDPVRLALTMRLEENQRETYQDAIIMTHMDLIVSILSRGDGLRRTPSGKLKHNVRPVSITDGERSEEEDREDREGDEESDTSFDETTDSDSDARPVSEDSDTDCILQPE